MYVQGFASLHRASCYYVQVEVRPRVSIRKYCSFINFVLKKDQNVIITIDGELVCTRVRCLTSPMDLNPSCFFAGFSLQGVPFIDGINDVIIHPCISVFFKFSKLFN